MAHPPTHASRAPRAARWRRWSGTCLAEARAREVSITTTITSTALVPVTRCAAGLVGRRIHLVGRSCGPKVHVPDPSVRCFRLRRGRLYVPCVRSVYQRRSRGLLLVVVRGLRQSAGRRSGTVMWESVLAGGCFGQDRGGAMRGRIRLMVGGLVLGVGVAAAALTGGAALAATGGSGHR